MKKILFLLFFCIGIVAIPIFAFTQEETGGNTQDIDDLNSQIEAKKQKIKLLEESIKKFEEEAKNKKLEAVSLSNQLSIIDNKLARVDLDMKATQQKLDIINLEIEQLNYSIDQKQKTIEKQKEIIGEMVRTIYQNSDKNFVEILATYDTFSEFYDQVQYLENIEEDLGKNLRSIKIAQIELNEKKQNAEERKDKFKELEEKLDNEKKDYAEQSSTKEQVLAQTQASELTYKTLVANLKKQYQAIEGEIQSIEAQVRKKLEEQQKFSSNEVFSGEFVASWPVPSRYITAYFHDPDYPYRYVFEHNAIDLRASQGTEVRSASPGYVATARRCSTSTCYSYVMIVHSGGFSTVYGHMSAIIVGEDQFVGRGEVIGYSGGTPGTIGAGPFVTGPHLHFEVRKNGIPTNPLNYMAP